MCVGTWSGCPFERWRPSNACCALVPSRLYFSERAVRLSILSRLSRSQRRTTEHVKSNDSGRFVDSGKKTLCIKELVSSWGGGVLKCEVVRVDCVSQEVSGPS
jgi:hypothetical protein